MKINKKKIIILSIIVVIIIGFIITYFVNRPEEKISKSFFCLDTSCTIDLRNMPKYKADNIISEAETMCKKYDDLLNIVKPNSDIYKANHSNGKPCKISRDTIYQIRGAQAISHLTKGQFDSTVGQLTLLWNFSAENPKAPKDSDIKKLLPTVGYTKINVGNYPKDPKSIKEFFGNYKKFAPENGGTVNLGTKGTWVDLGAIAKGFIADRLYDLLKSKGVKSAIINLGGNIAVVGGKTDTQPWAIGVEAPYSNNTELVDAIPLRDQTLVTSGVYERFIVKDGKKYHHVLDPKTGYSKKTDLLAISVLGPADASMLCDALSTSCLLMGKKQSFEFISKYFPDFAILTIDTDNKIEKSKNWPNSLSR